jgi:hypothetical protein
VDELLALEVMDVEDLLMEGGDGVLRHSTDVLHHHHPDSSGALTPGGYVSGGLMSGLYAASPLAGMQQHESAGTPSATAAAPQRNRWLQQLMNDDDDEARGALSTPRHGGRPARGFGAQSPAHHAREGDGRGARW